MPYVPNALLSRLVGDRLVAVTFVLDSYLQLQLDEANMNVEVWPEVGFGGRTWQASDIGYADSLRQMRGSTELGEPGEWMCWRPGEESFEHLR